MSFTCSFFTLDLAVVQLIQSHGDDSYFHGINTCYYATMMS